MDVRDVNFLYEMAMRNHLETRKRNLIDMRMAVNGDADDFQIQLDRIDFELQKMDLADKGDK